MDLEFFIIVAAISVLSVVVLSVSTILVYKMNNLTRHLTSEIFELKTAVADMKTIPRQNNVHNTTRNVNSVHPTVQRQLDKPSLQRAEVRKEPNTTPQQSPHNSKKREKALKKIDYTVEDHLKKVEQKKRVNKKLNESTSSRETSSHTSLQKRSMSTSSSEKQKENTADRKTLRQQIATNELKKNFNTDLQSLKVPLSKKNSVESFMEAVEMENQSNEEKIPQRDRSHSLKVNMCGDRKEDIKNDFESKAIDEKSPPILENNYDHPYLTIKETETKKSIPDHISVHIPKALREPPPSQAILNHSSPPATPKEKVAELNVKDQFKALKSSLKPSVNESNDSLDDYPLQPRKFKKHVSSIADNFDYLNSALNFGEDDLSSISTSSSYIESPNRESFHKKEDIPLKPFQFERSNIISVAASDRPDSIFSDTSHLNELKSLTPPKQYKQQYKHPLSKQVYNKKVFPSIISSTTTTTEVT